MYNFERQLIGEIPLHEAASYFVGMKKFPTTEAQIKTAGARMKSAAQQQIDKLLAGDMPEGKAGQFKPVAEIKEASAKAVASKAVKRGTELLTGSKAKAIRQAADDALGRAATQVAPLRPNDMPSVRTLREGSYSKSGFKMPGDSRTRAPRPIPGGPALKASKKLDTMAGTEAKKVDRTRAIVAGGGGAALGAGLNERLDEKAAAVRLKTAASKLGFGMNSPAGTGEPEANMEGGQPTPAASNLPAMPGGASMAPPSGPVQDPIAARPSTAPTVPVNYMGAELIAQAAQRANEVGFLRERLNAATDQNNMLTQQVQSIQTQLDEVNATQQSAGDTIMQATNEAVAASTRALQHSMQAANMRIGIQKMREAMMELASQDPESMGTLAQQQDMQDQAAMEQQAVNAGAGAPSQTATPATAGGSPAAEAPEEGGSESASESKSDSGGGGSKGTSVSIKTGASLPGGAVMPGALAGAALAGLMAHRQTGQGDAQRAQVQELETQNKASGGSFSRAADLARAKQQLAETELAEQNPRQYTARSTLKGGVQGAIMGSALNHIGTTLKQQGITAGGLLGKAL